MRRKPKEKSNTWWRKKCVTLAKVEAKERDGWICQHCGRSKAQGYQMQGSHVYPEGVYKSMSADADNILCLCAGCHTGGFRANNNTKSWHGDPVYFADWFREKYPELYQTLKLRSQESK